MSNFNLVSIHTIVLRLETRLVMISNDLLSAVDSGLLSILILLDLRAAFDTNSHSILLDRLESTGIVGIPLTWFESYSTCTAETV